MCPVYFSFSSHNDFFTDKVKKLFEFDYPPLKGGGFKPNSWLRHHNFFYCAGKA